LMMPHFCMTPHLFVVQSPSVTLILKHSATTETGSVKTGQLYSKDLTWKFRISKQCSPSLSHSLYECVYSYTRFIHTVPYLRGTNDVWTVCLFINLIPPVLPSNILLNAWHMWATADFRLLIQAALISVSNSRL
jgi:hypothetical protein